MEYEYFYKSIHENWPEVPASGANAIGWQAVPIQVRLVEIRPRSVGRNVRYWSNFYRVTKRGIWSKIDQSDRSIFDLPKPNSWRGIGGTSPVENRPSLFLQCTECACDRCHERNSEEFRTCREGRTKKSSPAGRLTT